MKDTLFNKLVTNLFESEAEQHSKDKGKASQLVQKASKKASKNQNSLNGVWSTLQTFIQMIKAWVKGEYKEIPYRTLIMILIGLLYFVSPIDLIPDFILGLGLIDDVAVISFLMKGIKKDLQSFKDWQNKKANIAYTIDYSKIHQ